VKTGLKMERLRAIAKEAAEQSGRGMVPHLSEPMTLQTALSLPGRKVFFHVSSADAPISSDEPVTLFIGPEGGWSDSEVQQAMAAKCTLMTLGKLTLRAETAAIVACFKTVH
jgi:16S rRNA (uracil1498-N3)-methyltransferase